MKKLTTHLYNLNENGEKILLAEAATDCFTEIVVNLHELIRLGFTPDEIETVLDAYAESNGAEVVQDIIAGK